MRTLRDPHETYKGIFGREKGTILRDMKKKLEVEIKNLRRDFVLL